MPSRARSDKAALRRRARARRAALQAEARAQLSSRIAAHVLVWLDGLASAPATVAIYLATPSEANLDALIEPLRARGIRVAAPCADGFAFVDAASTCATSGAKWREANGARVDVENLDVIFVPGVAFGRDGSRLGQGGGWFDRALANSRAIRVGVAFGCQVLDQLPVEEHDVAMHWIASEDGVAAADVAQLPRPWR